MKYSEIPQPIRDYVERWADFPEDYEAHTSREEIWLKMARELMAMLDKEMIRFAEWIGEAGYENYTTFDQWRKQLHTDPFNAPHWPFSTEDLLKKYNQSIGLEKEGEISLETEQNPAPIIGNNPIKGEETDNDFEYNRQAIKNMSEERDSLFKENADLRKSISKLIAEQKST